jgi:hypothetical protein
MKCIVISATLVSMIMSGPVIGQFALDSSGTPGSGSERIVFSEIGGDQMSISGKVVDSSGKPRAGLAAVLENKSGQSLTITSTDPSGGFTLFNVPTGQYLLKVFSGKNVLATSQVAAPFDGDLFDWLCDNVECPRPIEINESTSDAKTNVGDVWILNTKTSKKKQVTKGANLASPVFAPDSNGKTVLALKSGALMRIDVDSGKIERLGDASNVFKLLRFLRNDYQKLIVLERLQKNHVRPIVYDIYTETREPIPFSKEDQSAYSWLTSDSTGTEYGNERVFIDD